MVHSRAPKRSLKAREEESDDEPYSDELEGSSPSVLDTGAGGEIDSGSASGSDDEELGEPDGEEIKRKLSKVSFGTLAKAQQSISRESGGNLKRKRGEKDPAENGDKLQALRERLRELKAIRGTSDGDASQKKTKPATSKGKPSNSENVKEDESKEENTGSDSDASTSSQPTKSRSSKHAPAVQTSKRSVTRKRQIIEVKGPVARDPRFGAAARGSRPDEAAMNQKYAFLDDYRTSEMNELRAAIKKSKNEADTEKLKKKLASMESQQKAKLNKDKQQEIVREHRKQEKGAVKEGKKPFYLKKSEQKKLALIDRFSSMKGKQRDHVIERRRKKLASRDRRNIPEARRGA